MENGSGERGLAAANQHTRPVPLYAEVGDDGGVLLYSFEPPGLAARGQLMDAAIAAARSGGWAELLEITHAAAAALRATAGEVPGSWTGLQPLRGNELELTIVETYHRRGPVANGQTTATFEPDRTPLRREEIPALLALLAESRRRFADLCETGILSASKPAALLAFRSAPHRKTIAESLVHVADAERWYLSRLFPDLPRLPASSDAWERLASVRELVVAMIADLDGQDLALEARVNGELWTTRKVIRRLMYHEGFHRDCLRRDLAAAGQTF